MSRRAPAALAAGGLLAIVAATPVHAHAIGGTFQLPVPLWLYLLGAAAAVAASFAVTAVVSRRAPDRPSYGTVAIPSPLVVAGRVILRVVGLAWWYGAILAGFLVGDISPLPAVLLWIGIWVGLPIVAVLLGNPWPSMSPFRSTFSALEWVGRRMGVERLDAGFAYPTTLARWPAVVLLAAGVWAELVLPGREVAGTVAWLMLGYTLLTLAGMVLFGAVDWLRHGELFEVELGWFGRIGPVGRRSESATLCENCTDRCDPTRCVDCPECSVAADDRERRVELRPWFAGLTEIRRAGSSDATFIVLVLAGVSFDGMQETAFGATLIGAVQPPVLDALGFTGPAFLIADTLAFVLVLAAFLVCFFVVVAITHSLSHPQGRELRHTAGVYAATLLPIAAGYLVAHYLTLVIQGAVWLPSLLADPLMTLAPAVDWIPISLVWYLSVASIVGGHVAGIVLAHRVALRDAPRHAISAGLPMVALMIGYTVLSLWIIAQPIVIEPGPTPPAALP